MSALLVSEFITATERTELVATAMDYLERGVLERNTAGVKRYRKRVFNTQYCTPLISALGKRIAEYISIEDCPVDPYLGWIISVIQPGGFYNRTAMPINIIKTPATSTYAAICWFKARTPVLTHELASSGCRCAKVICGHFLPQIMCMAQMLSKAAKIELSTSLVLSCRKVTH
ncbi:MAG: hypothetical protein AAF542_15335 [Pseudomonadota bacterium]